MNIVVIVDPYSSATFLPSYFHRLGSRCIAVHTKKPSSSGLSSTFIPKDFFLSLVYDGCVSNMVDLLRSVGTTIVIPGIETGVALADILAERLSLRRNDFSLTHARRNKFEMQEQLRKSGLPAIKSRKVNSFNAARLEVNKYFGGFPIVVKPVDSGGADGVRLCRSEDDLREACRNILGHNNFFGIHNCELILQEYIRGDEYVVDSVSCEGTHFTANICRYRKEVVDGSFVYESVEYLPPEGELAKRIIAYNEKCLEALGVSVGPSHSEIYVTKDGPVMVEVGARLHGGKSGPLTIEECSDRSVFELVCDAYLDQYSFSIKTASPNKFHRYAVAVCFINRKRGVVKSLSGMEALKNMPGFFDLQIFYRVGKQVVPTRDLYTSPGWCVLVCDSREELNNLAKQVRREEAEGRLYEIE